MPIHKLIHIWGDNVDFGNGEFLESNYTVQDVIDGKTPYHYTVYPIYNMAQLMNTLHAHEASFDYDAFKANGWYLL